MQTAENGDVKLTYETKGQGRPVLCLHGHTQDHRVFNPLVEPLTDGGQQLILPDLRGHGKSSRPDQGYHWSHHAADMVAVLDDAGVERAVVVGFSVGGGVALELALIYPHRVQAVVLVAPVMPDRPFEAAFMDNLRQVARTIRSAGVAAAMAGPWAESPLFAASFEVPGVRERVAEIVADFPGAEYLATARDAVQRDWQMPDRLAEIKVPTLVLGGERDMPGFRAFADEAASEIPGAVRRVIPGAGHLVPLEAPDAVVKAVLEI